MAPDSDDGTDNGNGVEFPMVDEDEVKTMRKVRRQTAFYPNVNSSNKTSKPFSRSAAKRESVMALGSIEHLQHYFTKTGLASKQKPQVNGLVAPAIGGLQYLQTSPSGNVTNIVEEDESELVLPPLPTQREAPRPSFIKKIYETDPEYLKPGVIEDLRAVEKAWSADESQNADVLALLQLTTRSIRSVRNYTVSLPEDATQIRRPQAQYRPSTMRPLLQNRISSSSLRTHATGPSAGDSKSATRRLALEVLHHLHKLEEIARLPLSDEAYDIQSDRGSQTSRSASHSRLSPSEIDEDLESDASFSFSVVQVPGRTEHIRVWSNEDDDALLNLDDDAPEKERWDERIVLGSGWLYKQDISFRELREQRVVVKRYLDTVDDAFFGGRGSDGRRGWEVARITPEAAKRNRNRRSITPPDMPVTVIETDTLSSPMSRLTVQGLAPLGLEDLHASPTDDGLETARPEVEDSDLPEWARRISSFASDPLARAHALLVQLLPSTLLHVLPFPDDEPAPGTESVIPHLPFLQALSSGQLLCVAYNAAVRRSRKQWGFINLENVHDVVGLETSGEKEETDEGGRKVGWTFRRIDNLRLWVAALKLRYLVPISSTQPTVGKTKAPHPTDEPPIPFEPRTVARRDEGWEVMLERLVLRWVEEVVAEKRTG